MDKNNLKNNMSAKNWVKGFVFTSLILLLAVILINILRDPMMLTPFSNKLNNDVKIVNERQQKINYMTYNKIKYNGVVLGSSRATYFDTTVFPKEKNLYNISFNGGILPEYKSYLDYFDKKNNAEIEYIYLGLDFFQYITLYETSEKAEKYIKNTEDKLYRIKTLLSANSLIYSLYPYKFSQQYLVRKGGYKITNEKINIIFCTTHQKYMAQAIELHVSGYVLKPVRKDKINHVLDNLLYPVQTCMPHFFARTFGMFDFFVDGKPLKFIRSKSKEMLAYLISVRGSSVTRKQLSAVLFEDEYDTKSQNYFTKIYNDLKKTLKSVGADEILCKEYNTYSVNTKLFGCDLYDYDEGSEQQKANYKGVFMSQYDWSEI